MDGQAVKSCTILTVQADGASVTTIEGLAPVGTLHPVQLAYWNEHGLQCGFCTPGMVLSTVALLADDPDPSEESIRHGLEGNICRALVTTTLCARCRRPQASWPREQRPNRCSAAIRRR